LVPIFKTIQKNNKLKFLSLFQTSMQIRGAEELAKALLSNQSLSFLRITDDSVRKEEWIKIFDSLIKTKIHSFYFCGVSSHHEVVVKVAEFLRRNHELKSAFIKFV